MKVIGRVAALALLLSVLGVGTVSALTVTSDGFVVDNNGQRTVIPAPYQVIETMMAVGGETPELNNPQDLFWDAAEESYYIADTGNDRIVKLDKTFHFLAEYREAGGLSFAGPIGVSTDAEGHLFIADAGNARVVHLDENGEYIEAFVKPESDLLYNVEYFSPAKVELNPLNQYLYVIQGKQFMMIDAGNQFRGYIGANEVGFDLWDFIFRKFATETQKMKRNKREPDAYTNFCLGKDGRIYAVGLADNQRISVLNTVGNNIYPAGDYGVTQYDRTGKAEKPVLSDIGITSKEVLTVADEISGYIYQYDMQGNMLCAFGGKGSSKGYFGTISSLVVDSDDRIVTLDAALGRIQVFESTPFIRTVHNAVYEYYNGNYTVSGENWDAVKSMNAGYTLARNFIGEIKYKNEDYDAAMHEFRQGNDQASYGKAFERVRYQAFQKYFVAVVLAAAAVVGLFVLVVVKGRAVLGRYRREIWSEGRWSDD